MARRSTNYTSVAYKALRPGRLIIYVGAAPGVGKTYKMLQDANDWKMKGIDVVIGWLETHGRTGTAEQVQDLEIIPRKVIRTGNRVYEELDTEAIMARQPRIVLIDELAHTNAPGSAREKRYQDIEYLLSHGIHVVTTVNIQHLESLHDKVEHITGVQVRERIPDWFIDLANEVKMVDVSPETLQQRLIDGQIYSSDKIDQALNHFFRLSNLSALREIALLEVADDVEQRLHDQISREKGTAEAETVESTLVCVNSRPHSAKLIRRGWRIADRHHSILYVLVVVNSREMTERERQELKRIERLCEQFDAIFMTREVHEQGVGRTIVEVAEELHVAQLVIGQPMPGRTWWERLRGNPVDYVLQHAEFVDLHVVSNERGARCQTS
ncbi:MAG: universal stress protein [Alicyclobacillaceae bacterium]|uniref:universal stress protein n=1 Tax=Alicyclobacillus sp. SP_1 TaxID=2942475 RepID=UPI002157C95C|nr:universal stress protein [Alicyclobacillus sp. SP_1]MCY0888885.1 universal stress protein [Alicyclobacillaceae bacterium]MCY0896303.1 universal stress protein [Alicyclobacillaceae bacterium]